MLIGLVLGITMPNSISIFAETENDEEVYRIKEIESKRDTYSTVYLNSDGTETWKFHSTPIRYYDDNGELVDIDTGIKEIGKKGKGYKTIATEVDVILPEEVNNETPVVLSYGSYSVRLSPITRNSAKDIESRMLVNTDEASERSDDSEPSEEDIRGSLESAAKSSGRLYKEEVEDIYGNSEKKNVSLIYDAFSDERTNKNINAIELEYVPLNDGIKENIVINKNVGIYRFDFYLEMEGYVPEMTDYGAILLKDELTEEVIGVIPVPMAYDVNEIEREKYDVVHYELVKSGEGYLLSVVVDK